MDFTFLGAGSAFSVENWQSNMLVELEGKRLLIDAGGDVRHALHAQGLRFRDLDAVYISHLHGDHMHGMEGAALMTYYDPSFVDAAGAKRKLKLAAHSSLVGGIWDSLKGACPIQCERAALDSYFEVVRCNKRTPLVFQSTKFHLVRTVHYMDNNDIVPSFGLFWTAPNGQKVFLTTDTQFFAGLNEYYKRADVIFHDCETTRFPTGVHAHYRELVSLPAEVKKKMWLYHYQDGAKPSATADGFAGWVVQGQKFQFSPHGLIVSQRVKS